MSKKQSFSLRDIAVIGVFSAISVVLILLVRFPLFASAKFLEFDFGDIPILIVSFFYGPVHGLVITLVVSVIQGITVSADSGIYGILMHIISSGTFALTAGLVYRGVRQKGKKLLAVASLASGCVAVALVMSAANVLITPLFTGMPRGEIIKLILPLFIPFNLIKTAINSVITYFVYKPISRLLSPKMRPQA